MSLCVGEMWFMLFQISSRYCKMFRASHFFPGHHHNNNYYYCYYNYNYYYSVHRRCLMFLLDNVYGPPGVIILTSHDTS